MKKIVCLLCLVFLALPVFAGVTEFMERALNSWVGYNINDMINYWGFPTEEKTIANRHIYIWNRTRTQYIPQRTNSTVTPNVYNTQVSSYTTGGYYVTYTCNKTIEVDANNTITSWSWEGNACPGGYRNGKKLVNPANDEWERERLRRIERKKEDKILKQYQKEQKKLEKMRKKEAKRIEKETKAEIKKED